MVQPDNDLAVEIAITWDDQQGRDVGQCHWSQERQDDFNPDKLPS